MSTPLSRRRFLQGTGAAAALPATGVAFPHVPPRRRVPSPVAVASHNGLIFENEEGESGVEVAVRRMKEGWRPVDAAVAGVEICENDPEDASVGYGGLPNEDGVVQLDSCVMDGPSGLGGAVAALRNIKNPAQVALKVMRHTDHVLLVGEGALRFARAHGFREEDLLTDQAREAWLRWKARRSDVDDWIHPDENAEHGKEWMDRDGGTIHMGCVNAQGAVGGCTTTSGLAFKIPGRVGDSPLLGCGNYVDNDVGVAGSTGRGEAVILSNGAAFVVHQMALGKEPVDACLEACRRIARMTKSPRLLDDQGRPDFGCKFYAIRKEDGKIGGASLRGGGRYARFDENGPSAADLAVLID